MRSLLALLLFSLTAPAHATLIQYDISGTSGSGGAVATSLLLDTAGASAEFFRRSTDEGLPDSCFSNFGATLGAQILGVSVDGTPALGEVRGVPGVATVGGAFRDVSCDPGNTSLAGGLSIAADTYQLDFFYRMMYDLPTADEVLATADPLATVLLNGTLMGFGDISLQTATGGIAFTAQALSIRDVSHAVPEPPMLLLLSLGLTGLVLGHGIRRRSLASS